MIDTKLTQPGDLRVELWIGGQRQDHAALERLSDERDLICRRSGWGEARYMLGSQVLLVVPSVGMVEGDVLRVAVGAGDDGWRPIATAPRDGRRIRVWVAAITEIGQDAGDAHPATAHWTEHNAGGWVWHGLAGTPTHWRPLEGPPSGST
ncbi:MAG: hypothetical protein VW338_15840 [Rhodospirillaceae bacterium]